MKNLKLTELESKVIQFISEGDEFNEVASVCLEDICDDCEITLNQAKGVLGSLIKKGVVLDYTEFPNGMTAYCLVSEYDLLPDLDD